MDIAPLLLTGIVAGVLAGLLGIGGGVIIVPVVSLVLQAQGVGEDVLIKVAVGTSLATIMVTAISSVYTHHRKGAVDWPIFRRLAPWIVAGTVAGTVIADLLPGRIMYLLFVAFLFVASIRMALGKVEAVRELPGTAGLAGFGMLNGTVSALMGIGGGIMNVPYLSYCSVPIKRAIATAAAIGLPLATASTVGYAISGANEQGIPGPHVGYINLPIFAAVVVASMLFAPLGAKLAHRLPDRLLKIGFAVFIFVLALRMAWSVI